MSLLAILGPGFARQFAEANTDDSLPWEDDDLIHPDDRMPPTRVGIFDPIPMPRDPYRQLSDDAE